MLNHSFVLDCLDTTAPDTFSHFEMLIEEHRFHDESNGPSRLRQLVPTVGTFHTHLPLRKAFIAYNKKYALTKRKFITISFNELRHILNLAQIMALRGEDDHDDDNHEADRRDSLHTSLKEWANSPGFFHHDKDVLTSHSPPTEFSLGDPAIQESAGPTAEEKGTSSSSTNDDVSSMSNKSFRGPTMITFDGDQTLYRDGANFEGNPQLANYLYLLLRHGVTLAVVTAAGYEYNTEKYELRLSGLLSYFKSKNLPEKDCERFYLFGGECNFLLKVSLCQNSKNQTRGFVAFWMFMELIKGFFRTIFWFHEYAVGSGLQTSSCERIWSRWMENCYKIHPRYTRELERR